MVRASSLDMMGAVPSTGLTWIPLVKVPWMMALPTSASSPGAKARGTGVQAATAAARAAAAMMPVQFRNAACKVAPRVRPPSRDGDVR
ncbi:MAG: hypothetical protein COW30_05310 [Rhodospirillales bacterium CG15_BIG_FIL_POST_REV_8_21_14_020_66_15]|nr:MAG: hypothetical protein COW30_05310 [Rhodospirillales bacterium CG15_BIG_FIL_POST_REV_8_21_14_020_66_15]